MSEIFGRVFRMTIAGESESEIVEITEVRVVFNVAKTSKETIATATLYNLSPQTRAKISKGKIASIFAGYSQRNGMIFAGEIIDTQIEYESVNTMTKITARAGAFNYKNNVISEAFPVGSTAKGILNELSLKCGVPVVMELDGVKDVDYPAGYSYFGTIDRAMDEVSARLNCRTIHRGDSLLIQVMNATGSPTVYLSPDSGLLGYPKRIEKSADNPDKQKKSGLDMKKMFNADGSPNLAEMGKLATAKVTEVKSAVSTNGKLDAKKLLSLVTGSGQSGVTANKPIAKILGWGIECLLDSRITLGTYVKIDDQVIGGKTYRIEEVEHNGDTEGDEWTTSLKVYE